MKHFFQYSIATPAAFLLLVFFVSRARAQIGEDRPLSYQGIVVDQKGVPPSDGQHAITVNFYSTQTGGTPVYTETQTVLTVKGLFNLLIGQDGFLPNHLPTFQALYLGVQLDGGAEMVPRTVLASAPSAYWADTARFAKNVVGGSGVNSVNNVSGIITLQGGGSTQVTQNGQTITITSTGGSGGGSINTIQSDGTLAVTSPNGPTTTIIIPDKGVTFAKIGSGNATSGQVITANGAGGAAWQNQTATLTLPLSQTVSSSSDLLTIINSGAGSGISGSTTATTGGAAGVKGSTASNGGYGVWGNATNASAGTGVVGVSAGTYGSGVYGDATDNTLGGTGVYGHTLKGSGVYAKCSTGGNAFVANYGGGANSSTATNDNIALFENSGAVKARVDMGGVIYSAGGVSTDGHLISTSTIGAVTGDDGTHVTSESVTGSDIAGSVTINTTANSLSGAGWATFNFGTAYAKAPIIVVTATNSDAAASIYYVTPEGAPSSGLKGFTINLTVAASKTYKFNYMVIQ